jgi:hypothetical protein
VRVVAVSTVLGILLLLLRRLPVKARLEWRGTVECVLSQSLLRDLVLEGSLR